MLNAPAFNILESVTGLKAPAMLANLPDINVSERTLRKPIWSNKTVERIKEASKKNFRSQLQKLGWPKDKIDEYISAFPQSPYSGLIYQCQIPGKIEFSRTMELASGIDAISYALYKARGDNDLEKFRAILLSSKLLDRRYYVNDDEEWDASTDPIELKRIKEKTPDWGEFDGLLRVLMFNSLFSVMSHWDVELFKQFFPSFHPRSIFAQMFPRLDPKARYINESTVGKRRGMFWIPVRRLIDFLACLGYYRTNKFSWPDEVPKVSDIARMTGYRETELVNLRDGTKRFLISDFRGIWDKLLPDTLAPTPLFIAAKLWQSYFLETDPSGKPKTVYLFADRYLCWWEEQSKKLTNNLSSASVKREYIVCYENDRKRSFEMNISTGRFAFSYMGSWIDEDDTGDYAGDSSYVVNGTCKPYYR